jgi:mRNA-degrading endonuclease HigB of HigAB toxin-antitoxin module
MLFIIFSPLIVPKIPGNMVDKLPKCYKVLFNSELQTGNQDNSAVLVFGDSYAVGQGDEMLQGEEAFGFFKKINTSVPKSYLNFGVGGAGPKTSLTYFTTCSEMLDRWTIFNLDSWEIDTVTWVFYEGNDVYDAKRENAKPPDVSKIKRSFFSPLYTVTAGLLDSYIEWNPPRSIDYNVMSENGISIEDYPQSGTVEISDEDVENSLASLRATLVEVAAMFPDAEYRLVYIPSVVSSYSFDGPLLVQSAESGKGTYLTDFETHATNAQAIRMRVQSISQTLGFGFCDTTPGIQSETAKGVAVHGPIDWRHFNEIGYQSVADSYNKCF